MRRNVSCGQCDLHASSRMDQASVVICLRDAPVRCQRGGDVLPVTAPRRGGPLGHRGGRPGRGSDPERDEQTGKPMQDGKQQIPCQ